jgi:hypothetical protein
MTRHNSRDIADNIRAQRTEQRQETLEDAE